MNKRNRRVNFLAKNFIN